MAEVHFWRQHEIDFLKEYYPSNTRKELTKLFNEHFNLNLTVNQVASALTRNEVKSGRTGHFEKGHTFSKGNNGSIGKRRGDIYNYRPLGTERIGKGGYVYMKVNDKGERWSDRWKMKHIVIWEAAHGKIPAKHCLVFLDGDKQNISLENLQLITREQLAIMNKKQLLKSDKELNKSVINIAKVYSKINEINRRGSK